MYLRRGGHRNHHSAAGTQHPHKLRHGPDVAIAGNVLDGRDGAHEVYGTAAEAEPGCILGLYVEWIRFAELERFRVVLLPLQVDPIALGRIRC